MAACACDGRTPVVSHRLGRMLLERLSPRQRERARLLSFAWLAERHPFVDLYAIRAGMGPDPRDYTWDESQLIAQEVSNLVPQPCPFAGSDGCALGGLGEVRFQALGRGWLGARWLKAYDSNRERAAGPPYAWLPFWIAKATDSTLLRTMARAGKIADAKLATFTRHRGLEVIESDRIENVLGEEFLERTNWEIARNRGEASFSMPTP